METLLSPISDNRPEGADLAYSNFYESIVEARRADDPTLPQGQWAKTLKVADWGKVRQLCEEGLGRQSKDLQLAAWFAEAMTRLEGFKGAASGLRLTGELLLRFQETLYPKDPEERIAKLEWLNNQLGTALRQIPLTVPQHGGYDWYRWNESREVENLQRRGGTAFEAAIKEGKLTVDDFNKSARESGVDWYRALLGDLTDARTAYDELAYVAKECFEDDAPGFAEIREALDVCQDVARRLFELCGGRPDPGMHQSQPLPDASPNDPHLPDSQLRLSVPSGPITSRAGAIHQLREVARYFREHEPHSPVALLAERAAKWAEMPLEHWLKTVIKDEPTLKQLRELLDLRPD
ncbi:MAG: type VI secretion system protein TssA [Betaproteobacteria bacterium]|nr:type VI secretion system protein TssA [Betaproteobacteria bacterium]